MQCRHSTCADFADVACELLGQMGCDCRGCCLASSSPPPRGHVADVAHITSARESAAIIEDERWQPDAATAAAAKAAATAAAAAAAKAAAADIDLVALTEEAIDDGPGLDQAPAVPAPTRQGADQAGACSTRCVRRCLQDCSHVFHQHGLQASEKCYVGCSGGCLPKCLLDGLSPDDGQDGSSSPSTW